MKFLLTSVKATLLSSFLISLYLMVHENDMIGILGTFFLSVFITFFIASGMLFFTIMPFSLLEKDTSVVFKKYFPFYAIGFFSCCLGILIQIHFEQIVIAIFAIAYITAMQSWVWIYRPKRLKE